MKIWVKLLINTIILLVITTVWQYVKLKSVNWVEILVIALVFGFLDFIFLILESKYAKRKTK